MPYKKTIFERQCEWDGVDGNHYRDTRFIDVIFHTTPDTKPYLSYGGRTTCVGGGGLMKMALMNINCNLKSGEKAITEADINREVEKMREEIKETPLNPYTDKPEHWWDIPKYPGE